MEPRGSRNVLFLCTGNYYRSRFAEILFNHVAGGMGLSWKATSRALALERGAGNIGPMARAAVENLQGRGVRAAADFARFPVQATTDDFAMAHWIVALKQTEHVPMLHERFPAWAEKIECWEVDDDARALSHRRSGSAGPGGPPHSRRHATQSERRAARPRWPDAGYP